MTAVTMSGRVTIGDRTLRCPGTGAGLGPSRLRLVATGGSVRATCDKPHKQPTGKSASCWWVVDGLTAADLTALAEAKPGRVRATLTSGAVLEGKVVATDGPKSTKGAAKKPVAAGAFAKLKAAATPKPTAKASGKTTAAVGAKGSSGAAVAAFGALAAVAGAVGQTARATADIVGSGASVTREFTGVVRDGIRAVDNAGARDLVRHTTQQQAPAKGK